MRQNDPTESGRQNEIASECCLKMAKQDVEIPETGGFRRREAGSRDVRQDATATVLHLVMGVRD